MGATVLITILVDANLFAPVTFPWSTHWSSRSKKTFLMSTPKHLGVQIFRFTQVNLMIDPLGIKPSQQLYMVYSFTFYPALYVVIWCSATGRVSHTFINSENFCQFPGGVVVLLTAYYSCELHNTKHNYQININWFLGNNYEVFSK